MDPKQFFFHFSNNFAVPFHIIKNRLFVFIEFEYYNNKETISCIKLIYDKKMICETAYVNITSDSFKTLSLEKNAFLIKETSKLDKHKNTKDEYHFNFIDLI